MNKELTQQFEDLLVTLNHISSKGDSGWNFTPLARKIIKFKPFGHLSNSGYTTMAKNFDILRAEYFKNNEFLVLLFDFSDFKKASTEVRERINEGKVFKDERINIIIYGMNYFVSTMAKIISSKQVNKRLYVVKNEAVALEMATSLLSNYNERRIRILQEFNYYSNNENSVEVNGKNYQILSRNGWTYNDSDGDYSYKVELIDDNILVSRPSGYIRYQNSVMANVLFDKVVKSEIENNEKYYRIQDYSEVFGAENKARRDFTSYIINGINRIELMVFYGLNKTMRTIVRLGKLVHPAFVKVKIAETFEDAVGIIIAHKYKNGNGQKSKEKLDNNHEPNESSTDVSEPKVDYEELKKENIRYANILFDRISKTSFENTRDFIPVEIDSKHLFYDLFSAVQLLHEDFVELRKDRDEISARLAVVIEDNSINIQELKLDFASKIRAKEDFIRNSGYELGAAFDTVLNAIRLLNYDEDRETQNNLIQIIKTMSNTIDDGIRQLKSVLVDNQKVDVLSESMFNYRKNLIQLIEMAKMGKYNNHIIFENTIEDNLPTYLIGDKRKFNQLVSIFLENALKFTNSGFIKVYTHVVKKQSSQTRFRFIVEDSGIGIDEETKKQIFRSDSRVSTKPDNSYRGFGLLIAKSIANVLDAEIGFESEIGTGSKFWVELTFNNGFHDKATQMNEARAYKKSWKNNELPLKNKKALIICNDTNNQHILEQVLKNSGLVVRVKSNYESVEELGSNFDYVFLGIKLIGGAEIGSIKLLMSKMYIQNDYILPVYIACVDNLVDSIIEEYRKIGINYFIQKNIKISDMNLLIEQLK